MQPIIIVHGGAGDIPDSRIPAALTGVREAVREGYKSLTNGGSALDAVEKAVNAMERNPCFNAGIGSCLNSEEEVEVEASIMDGATLKVGCCTLLHDIVHPISVARKVMENTKHNFLGGPYANEFAKDQGFEVLPKGSLVTESAKERLQAYLEKQKLGEHIGHGPETVGAVAMDKDGNIAVATSTGGFIGKLPGRIGDTPLIGCGTYADNEVGGVSTTGHGETIMKFNLAQKILAEMRYTGASAQEATQLQTDLMTKRLVETAGAITIGKDGKIGVYHSSKQMSYAYIEGDGQDVHFGIQSGDDMIEKA